MKIINVNGVRVEAYKAERREDMQLFLGSVVLAIMAVVICLLVAKIWGLNNG